MQIDIRKLTLNDYDELKSTMEKAYPAMSENIWSKKAFKN
jgi:hypothetical protein